MSRAKPPVRAPSQREVAARLERAETALHSHGLPMTVQRRALLEEFTSRTDHPTVERLHADLRERLPGVNRATVYRTLEKLVELGLAARLAHFDAEVRYEPCLERHDHLVCERCGSVEDVFSAPHSGALDGLRPPRGAAGFQARTWSVQFRGLCGRCVQREGGRSS